MRPELRKAIAIAAVLAALIAGLCWRATLGVAGKNVPLPPQTPPPVQPTLRAVSLATPVPVPQMTEPAPRQPEDLQPGLLPWEAAVLEIERVPSGPGEKARALFALLPRVPEEALLTTTEQAAAWLRDADYATLAAPLLLNPQTHGSVMSALFADLMQRPDGITMPALLAVARDPAHPFAPQARENLALVLGQDRGTDWVAWDAAIHQKLETERRR